MPTILEAIATGNPPLKKPQMEAAAFMQQIEGLPDPVKNRLPAIYRRSGIDYRYSCVEDYGREPEDFTFYPKNWALSPAPSTAERNRKYREAVVPLAERVAGDALDQADAPPDDITHVVVVSCTGFFAPGLDIELVRRLGLPPDTQRTVVGFMGCYAAFNGLRAAHGFCQSTPGARVLLVCAELCTLHFQVDDSLESAIVNGLFADGAAAAVLAERSDEEAQGELAYAGNHTVLDDDSMGDMTWEIGDTGFLMGLAPSVPDTVSRLLPNYLGALLHPHDLDRNAIDFWAIHPGGRAIVEKAQAILNLADEEVHDSLEILRLYGNMSSPTILFVLKRFLDRRRNGKDHLRNGVAMAFGPGLTLEGALFQEVR
jgi:predicted naringenin-chalcone synthase